MRKKQIRNLAAAYSLAPDPLKMMIRKTRKSDYSSREFQLVLKDAGDKKRLAAHTRSCLQAYEAKKAKVAAGVGSHTLSGII